MISVLKLKVIARLTLPKKKKELCFGPTCLETQNCTKKVQAHHFLSPRSFESLQYNFQINHSGQSKRTLKLIQADEKKRENVYELA